MVVTEAGLGCSAVSLGSLFSMFRLTVPPPSAGISVNLRTHKRAWKRISVTAVFSNTSTCSLRI